MKTAKLPFMILAILCSIVVSVSRTNIVRASGTVYIRVDGTVDPSTEPIQRNGDLYTLTGNISSDADGIRIERDNMTLDGAGYTLQGARVEYSAGAYLESKRNVTIRNLRITAFSRGTHLKFSTNNTVTGSVLIANDWEGILISGSSMYDPTIGTHNSIVGNYITKNGGSGISLSSSSNNTVIEDNITDNMQDGINLFWSSNNVIYHNRFVNNTRQVYVEESYNNSWDDGTLGNYWSNYDGPDANGDGVGDLPYVINADNGDRYPIIPEFSSLLFMSLFMTATTVAIIARRKKVTF